MCGPNFRPTRRRPRRHRHLWADRTDLSGLPTAKRGRRLGSDWRAKDLQRPRGVAVVRPALAAQSTRMHSVDRAETRPTLAKMLLAVPRIETSSSSWSYE